MLAMIDERAPVAKEKATTPKIMRKTARIFSDADIAVISPYPTVTIVVIEK
jgi:hypothetical protein